MKTLLALLMAVAAGLASAQLSTMRGVVYLDENGSCSFDRGEPYLGERLVAIESLGSDKRLRYAQTNGFGEWSAADLPEGEYLVYPTQDPGTETTQPPQGVYRVTLPAGASNSYLIGLHRRCIRVQKQGSVITSTNTPGCFRWTLTFRNQTNFPITDLYFFPPTGVTVMPYGGGANNHYVFPTPIAPGQTVTIDLKILGTVYNQSLNMPILVHDFSGDLCCETVIKGVKMPPRPCFELVENRAQCRDGGGFNWSFCIANTTGKVIKNVLLTGVRDSANRIVGSLNQTNFANVNLQPGQKFTQNLIINGPPDAMVVFVDVRFYDSENKVCCVERVAIRLPDCQRCIRCLGIDGSLKPLFTDAAYSTFTGSVAAVTCAAIPGDPTNPDGISFGYKNILNYWSAAPKGTNWAVSAFEGPADPNDPNKRLWRQKYTGTIFGLTIDKRGHTYVTQFGLYPVVETGVNQNTNVTRTFGLVLRIDNTTGNITEFARLPNHPTLRPGLGNITYDYHHDQFWVTNFEDGLIYRVPATGNMTGNWNANQYYGPFVPSTTKPDYINTNGIVPLGQRVWGIQYHCRRLYFARWSEHLNAPNPTDDNDIWSVAIDASTGTVVPGTLRREPGQPVAFSSQPVSDISFSPEGYMGLAEMTMMRTGTNDMTSAHSSKAIEYRCDPATETWTPLVPWVMGGYSGTNCHGGIDYDYIGGLPISRRRTFITGGLLNLSFPNSGAPWAYGVAAFTPTGGISTLQVNQGALAQRAVILDLDNQPGYEDKRFFGDVEVPRF